MNRTVEQLLRCREPRFGHVHCYTLDMVTEPSVSVEACLGQRLSINGGFANAISQESISKDPIGDQSRLRNEKEGIFKRQLGFGSCSNVDIHMKILV